MIAFGMFFDPVAFMVIILLASASVLFGSYWCWKVLFEKKRLVFIPIE